MDVDESYASVSESATVRKEWIAPAFHHLVDAVRSSRGGGEEPTTTDDAAEYEARVRAAAEAAVAGALTEAAPGTGVYTFDLFTETFRAALLREVDTFERTDLPRRRPNTMNAAGLIVNEIGGAHSLFTQQHVFAQLKA